LLFQRAAVMLSICLLLVAALAGWATVLAAGVLAVF
jgi:hypothetical protein